MRRCLGLPGQPCTTLVKLGRCPAHTLPARGYGWAHQRGRAALALNLPAPCGYGCGTILQPGSRWVAAHVVDGLPSAGLIASCRSCNERAKGTGWVKTSLRA